jgi:hypothetical protein
VRYGLCEKWKYLFICEEWVDATEVNTDVERILDADEFDMSKSITNRNKTKNILK